MFRNERTERLLTQLLQDRAIAPAGPSPSAAQSMVVLGAWHGRRQKRWKPVEELVRRLIAHNCNALEAQRVDELRSMRSELAQLKADKARIEAREAALLSTTSIPSGNGTRSGELLDRRDAAVLRSLRGRVEAVDQRIATVEPAINGGLAEHLEALAALDAAGQSLWSAYRVAYVQALPGPADAQRLGPTIPATAGSNTLTQRTSAPGGTP